MMHIRGTESQIIKKWHEQCQVQFAPMSNQHQEKFPAKVGDNVKLEINPASELMKCNCSSLFEGKTTLKFSH